MHIFISIVVSTKKIYFCFEYLPIDNGNRIGPRVLLSIVVEILTHESLLLDSKWADFSARKKRVESPNRHKINKYKYDIYAYYVSLYVYEKCTYIIYRYKRTYCLFTILDKNFHWSTAILRERSCLILKFESYKRY